MPRPARQTYVQLPMTEPISPELVLVSPELRAEAIATLSDPEWASVISQVRMRARDGLTHGGRFARARRNRAAITGLAVAAVVALGNAAVEIARVL
jgi:hypothetical protein